MPVKPIRRLTVPAQGLYDLMSREALHAVWSRRELDEIQRDHPELVIEHAGNLLTASKGNRASLCYAFRSDAAFADHFAPMFEKLLPRLRKASHPESLRFRLTHNPSRPVVEPVVRRLGFAPEKAWLGFSLDRKTGVPAAPTPRGVRVRDASIDDAPELARVDREAFPNTPMPEDAIRELVRRGEGALVATAGREVVGFALFELEDTGGGYLRTLAVAEDHRDRGIGAALTARVAKWAFAQGAPRLDLKTEEDNGGAMRLYMRLGFSQSGAGRDYARPADPKVIERMRSEAQGTVIRFGGWR